jgi:hypothetical protein
VGVLPH